MSATPEPPVPSGLFDARYLAFLETITQLRPSLHRYCARMTGSVMDGEDVVQEALFEAFRQLNRYDESRALKPWLFRIAHNRCIDHLRKRGVRIEADATAAAPDFIDPEPGQAIGLGSALEHLVINLPPKERACVLLKDVFDHSLEEIAGLVDTTVGGVKAALHRGRAKLKAAPAPRRIPSTGHPELVHLLGLYVERFNRRDWTGILELIRADARLTVIGRYDGPVIGSPYFSRYEQLTVLPRLVVGEVEGEPMIIVYQLVAGRWMAGTPIRVDLVAGRIGRIVDYIFCPWMLGAAASCSIPDV